MRKQFEPVIQRGAGGERLSISNSKPASSNALPSGIAQRRLQAVGYGQGSILKKASNSNVTSSSSAKQQRNDGSTLQNNNNNPKTADETATKNRSKSRDAS